MKKSFASHRLIIDGIHFSSIFISFLPPEVLPCPLDCDGSPAPCPTVSSPVPFESKDGSLTQGHSCFWISNSLLWRWRWNWSLGWCRSMSWDSYKEYFQKKFQIWVIQRYPIRSCHPRRIPQRKSWRCQSLPTSDIPRKKLCNPTGAALAD